jgi:hypothetical protein
MTWVAVAIGGSALLGYVGAKKQAGAAESASQMQYQATQDAAKQQREMFDILNAQQAPYREAGYGALNQINTMLPQFTKEFTSADLIRNLDPSYQFMLQQGLGATGQAMNVGGGGSNVDLARTKFATDYATNVGLPQYLAQRTGIYNTLANIAGIGQKSQEQSTGIASSMGQLGVGGATALAGGQIGASNAMAGAYGNIGNNLMLSQLISPQGGGITPGGVTTMNPELANSYFGSIKT